MKEIFAVIDTNVILSALITKKSDVATVKTLNAFFDGKIKALVHQKILAEYREVLSRKKFSLSSEIVSEIVKAFSENGVFLSATPSDENFSHESDKVFYEVTLTARKNYRAGNLVTGNLRHFPTKPFVVSPAEFVAIVEKAERENGGV